MQIEVLADKAVSPNLEARDSGVTCAYPSATRLPGGAIACVYRAGTEKHSYDGRLMLQTSSDGGDSWSEPLVVFDGRGLQPPVSVGSGSIGATASRALLAAFSVVDATHPGVYVFSEEARGFKRQILVVRSEDQGKTWSTPAAVEPSALPRAGVASKPFVLPNGELCMPLEVETSFGPSGTAAVFSNDDGRTFGPPVMCAADPEGRLNLCDARFTILKDGRILMLLWTFLQETEETIEVHRSYSSDNGRTWSAAEATGVQGQICAPLALPSGAVIGVSNFRHPPEGSRLWLSPDGGTTWDLDHPIQMWDVRQSRLLGEPIAAAAPTTDNDGVWDALERFTFGTPDLLYLDDGSIVLIYYATIDGVTHVRACRFRLK